MSEGALQQHVWEAAERLFGLDLHPSLRDGAWEALLRTARRAGAEPEAWLAALAEAPPDAACWRAALPAIEIGETSFMRAPEQLALLASRVLPGLQAAARAQGRPLSLWSAGCATGQEAYSLALLAGAEARVLGTDIDEPALAVARSGRYGPRAVRGLDDATRDALLAPAVDRTWQVRPALAERVAFRRHNLMDPQLPAGEPFDVIVCRNVLIYFRHAVAAATAVRLAHALVPGGGLVLGVTEAPPTAIGPAEPLGGDFLGLYVRRTRAQVPASGGAR